MYPKRPRSGSVERRNRTAAGVAGGVSAVTLGVAFALLALGAELFWIAFPLGFGVVLPVATAYAGAANRTDTTDETGALAELRRRYAEGELTDEEFEHRVDRLLRAEGADRSKPASAGSDRKH